MADETPRPEELAKIEHNPPGTGWMDTPAEIKKGTYCYAANPKSVEYTGLPNPRQWNPVEDDWKLPKDWKKILKDGMKDRLDRFRSLKLFMDICVRCGACADKCHFFIGSGDPKNMPVLRAELLRSVYRYDFTTAGKILGKMAGARKMTEDVLKEWWSYFFQCSECRRCSIYCPYGIDTAEITILARELLNLLGLNIDWIATPGGQLLSVPATIWESSRMPSKTCSIFSPTTLKRSPAIKVEPQLQQKRGRHPLFITPSGDVFRRSRHIHLHGLYDVVSFPQGKIRT